MAGLGITVYLDENIDARLTDALNRNGYNAVHALSLGHVRVADEQHLQLAAGLGRAIVTHNFADFSHLHSEFIRRGESHEGIVLIPVRSFSELLVRLTNHLDTRSPAQQRNNLLWA